MEKEKGHVYVALLGANGRMGKTIAQMISQTLDVHVVFGVDKQLGGNADFPIYRSLSDSLLYNSPEDIDVIIDFSSPAFSMHELRFFARVYHVPMVIGTTGFSDEQEQTIEEFSNEVAIFKSSNMSYGVQLVTEVCEFLAKKLNMEEYDCEIFEAHHRGKKDSPSGTAIHLAQSIISANSNGKCYMHEMYGRTEKRGDDEIGIASIRAGAYPGTHTVFFASEGDTIEITHRANNREIFADGAIRAACFLSDKKHESGLYTMKDLVDAT